MMYSGCVSRIHVVVLIGESCAWEQILAWSACSAGGECCYLVATWPGGLRKSSNQFPTLKQMNHSQTNPDPPRIVFLFSDAGGGHRSAAEAIIEALALEFPAKFETEMVDILKQYGPPPINHLPELYPLLVRNPRVWKMGYELTNGPRRVRRGMRLLWPYLRNNAARLVREHPANLYVAVHFGANDPMLRLLGPQDPPYITVVTDLVTAHTVWYHPKTHLCLVPTEDARALALKYGLRPEQVQVVGLPVADRFCHPPLDRSSLRTHLGWPSERPVVLVVGGGEGMGPLESTAAAIARDCPETALAFVAGRNRALKHDLESKDWPVPTFIYGFVREMPDFMAAADILVTKAGPGTISEAMIAGLPMVINNFLPGQEEGNLDFVVGNGAGVWAPKPEQAAAAIRNWLDHPEQRQQAVQACLRAARPDAARRIAHILANSIRF